MILFNELVFGPLRSRRLGSSLGINLLPTQAKLCNFNCLYCECGWSGMQKRLKGSLPGPKTIYHMLDSRLKEIQERNQKIDSITFAGNGEPTLHPNFLEIVETTISLRNQYFPKAQTSVLSNGTQLHKKPIREALAKVDQCIIKLDAGTDRLFQLLNQPNSALTHSKLLKSIKEFPGPIIIQSLFLKGQYMGQDISNLKPDQVQAWLSCINQILPKSVMVYTLDREPPAKGLVKASQQELLHIKSLLKKHRIRVWETRSS